MRYLILIEFPSLSQFNAKPTADLNKRGIPKTTRGTREQRRFASMHKDLRFRANNLLLNEYFVVTSYFKLSQVLLCDFE